MEGLGLGDRLGQLGRTAKGLLESGLQGAGSARAGGAGGKVTTYIWAAAVLWLAGACLVCFCSLFLCC